MLRLLVAAVLGAAVLLATALLVPRVDEPFFPIIGGVLAMSPCRRASSTSGVRSIRWRRRVAQAISRFLSGQFLYQPVEQRDFPSRLVEVRLGRRSGEVLAVECKGPRVEVERTLPAFTTRSSMLAATPARSACSTSLRP